MLNDVVIANKSYAKMNVSSNETLDQIALKVLKQDCPEFLLPTKTMNIDGETEIRYELSEGIRMEYVPLKMKKKEFVQMLINMLTPFKICSDWFLDYHSILLDKKYILLGKDDYAVKYAYIPVAERAMEDSQIKGFFDDLIVSAEVTDDPGYTMMLFRIFKEKNATLMTLLDYIVQNTPQTTEEVKVEVKTQPLVSQIVNAIPEMKLSETPIIETVKSVVKAEKVSKEFGKDDVQADVLGGLFGEDDDAQTDKKKNKKEAKRNKKEVKAKEVMEKEPKTKDQSSKGIFSGLFGGKKAEDVQPLPVSTVQPVYTPNEAKRLEPQPCAYASYESDATEIGEEEDFVVRKDKVTLRLKDGAGFKCPPVIELDLGKGYATIGRFDKLGAMQSDFNFDATFSFISRVHVRVELVGDDWRMVDLSKNGTYLNGSALAPNIPYTFSSGDVITFTKKHSISYVVV